MGIDCLKCTNSACCKLIIEVNKKEYDSFKPFIKENFTTNTDRFISKNPSLIGKKVYFDKMYEDNFARMNKSNDGLCVLLDKKTMLCSVYSDRPNACKDYTTTRCSKIRKLCTN